MEAHSLFCEVRKPVSGTRGAMRCAKRATDGVLYLAARTLSTFNNVKG
jgi:hypothetical protein